MKFYSYLWLRENGTPYYVGKGCGKRAFQGGGRHKTQPPKDLSHIVIFPMANETEAFESEIALIELFGRKDNGTGILRNYTSGGEGTSGWRHPPEVYKRLGKIVGEANKRRIISEQTREKLAIAGKQNAERLRAMHEARRGIVVSEETRRKIGLFHKGKILSEESKQKISVAHKGKTLSKEHRLKVSQSLIGNQRTKGMKFWLGRKHSEESRRKISISKLGSIPWNKGKTKNGQSAFNFASTNS
jgi:hypothetical protein